MTRLLNGDVGSGKTAVAGTVAAVVARAGYQSILLVPTEILAKQHQESLHKLFQGRLSVVLWTAAQKDEVEKADIVVGTHAVLKEGFGLPRLALVVIDEQHRFGVRQRQHLRTSTGATPHMLSLSATPIPRTLALALYGDLAVSFLPDKPKDRLPVITRVIHASSRPSMHSCIMKEIEEGHQVFVICPLIEEKKGESGEVDETQFSLLTPEEYEREEKKTVVAEAGRLRREHPEYGLVEAIHGKMKAEEKRQIMDRMQKGEIQVLVATSVIEVGVDVSNATVMVIEGAERFGLAQLHQFRGRVGRGGRQSYCFLCPALRGQVIDERLKVLEESDSGFVIAEKDLQLRGPGELGGSLQAGLPDFRMASLTDTEFLLHVKGVAEECLREDATILEKLSVGGSSIVRASLE